MYFNSKARGSSTVIVFMLRDKLGELLATLSSEEEDKFGLIIRTEVSIITEAMNYRKDFYLSKTYF